MISHLCCILLLSVYAKWSYISRPYLLCTKIKGVQALPIEIREMDGSTFFLYNVNPCRATDKDAKR